MDSNKQSELAKKYWKGTASLAEENSLQQNQNGLESDEKVHFEQLKSFSQLSLGDDFQEEMLNKLTDQPAIIRPLIPAIFWKIAAVLVLGLTVYYISIPNQEIGEPMVIASEEEDTKKAFEMTKQALLLVSAKLNMASELSVGLDKFEATKAKIAIDKKEKS